MNDVQQNLMCDGSWEIVITASDLDITERLRVKGDFHIGGVMLLFVDSIGIAKDWSDYALWWPERNQWLLRTKNTLDQCGIHANTCLSFIPMHKKVHIQSPDQNVMTIIADFSLPVFSVVAHVCQDIGIRYPEELSLMQYDKTYIKSGKRSNYKFKQEDPVNWLNSSLSLMEQNIRDDALLMLRYKFYTFYDINPKIDKARIKFIFHQANLAILSDMVDCTEEEAILFAALQLQAQLQSSLSPEPIEAVQPAKEGVNDIDAALTDLQLSLESENIIDNHSLTHTSDGIINKLKDESNAASNLFSSSLEIKDTLKLFKPKKFPLKSFKSYYCVFKDSKIIIFENSQSYPSKPPLSVIELKGNEVIPDVNVNQCKFVIKLRVPQAKGITEYWLKFDNDRQYAKWMSACRLAATQGTIHNAEIYRAEMQSILAFLSLQTSHITNSINGDNAAKNPNHSNKNSHPSIDNIKTEKYLPKRIVKRHKSSQLTGRIIEAHHNVSSLSCLEAYMSYIKAWQALPEYGYTYFTVKFMGQKKEDLIAIAYNRIIKMDVNTGAHLHTWRFTNMKNWSVNWEIKMVILEFEDDNMSNSINDNDTKDDRVCFQCTCADCKVVHEFIGGYVFMSMRSKEDNTQVLDECLFHKLTGGWA